MKSSILIFFLVSFLNSYSQESIINIENKQKPDMSTYIKLTNEAEKLYEEKNYNESVLKYEEAIEMSKGKAIWIHQYNLACNYALLNKNNEAFEHLLIAINKTNCISINSLQDDKDLKSLQNDLRWNKIKEAIELKSSSLPKTKSNQEIIEKLEEVLKRDQEYRKIYDALVAKYGRESDTVNKIIKQSKISDSLNLIEVKKILDTRGWLSKDDIGSNGNMTLFLVIQHADFETQKGYLPMLREAVKKGNAHGSFLALLEDRILVKEGKEQIYGSQVKIDSITQKHFVLPIKDPKNVDKRRKEIGLSDLSSYLLKYGINWSNKNE